MSPRTHEGSGGLSRRVLLQAGAGLAGGVLLPPSFGVPALAVGVSDKPAIVDILATSVVGALINEAFPFPPKVPRASR